LARRLLLKYLSLAARDPASSIDAQNQEQQLVREKSAPVHGGIKTREISKTWNRPRIGRSLNEIDGDAMMLFLKLKFLPTRISIAWRRSVFTTAFFNWVQEGRA
jgi:hypothetical protein